MVLFYKFNTYFLRSLDASLFFRKSIFTITIKRQILLSNLQKIGRDKKNVIKPYLETSFVRLKLRFKSNDFSLMLRCSEKEEYRR